MSLLTVLCTRSTKTVVVRTQQIVTASSSVSDRSYTNTAHNKDNEPYYSPLLSEKRPDQFGRGGRASKAGVKVAVFGATGFLGEHFCAQLGTLFLLYKFVCVSSDSMALGDVFFKKEPYFVCFI
jgi:hypothetical protein